MARFGRHGRFMAPALDALGAEPLREFLSQLGVATEAGNGFHVYPASQSAALAPGIRSIVIGVRGPPVRSCICQ